MAIHMRMSSGSLGGDQNNEGTTTLQDFAWHDWSRKGSSAAVGFKVQRVASYSWDEQEDLPRVSIPGAPRCVDLSDANSMANMINKTMVKYGAFPKDENQFRFHHFPTEPMLLAAHICSRQSNDFNLADVDCACDSNILCKLIAWLRGDSSIVTVSQRNWETKTSGAFAFDMEIIGKKTLLLTRIEEDNIVSPESSKPTFGLSFEKMIGALPRGCESCVSFYRISRVCIGELNVLVRSQVDAVNSVIPDEAFHVEDTWHSKPSGDTLQWRRFGSSATSNSEVIELKTKSANAKGKDWAWNEWYPQMLFRGASHLVLCFQKQGLIKRPPTVIPFSDVEQKAEFSKKVMPILSSLLAELKLRAEQGGRLHVWCDGTAEANLKVSQSERLSRVPASISSSWPDLDRCYGHGSH